MFVFDSNGGTIVTAILAWLVVFAALFAANEFTRRFKWVGFAAFVVLPIVLTVMWFTVLDGKAYKDWFHLAKVYSSTAGCIIFWCIRFVGGTKKDGTKWRLADKKWFLCLAPLILAVNIAEACARDFEVGSVYSLAAGLAQTVTEQGTEGIMATKYYLMGGSWNYMNAIAGILNIITITGWFGICIRKKTKKDGSCDMLWPDMLWFWIIAYDLWNFAYTYNCLPHHAWYCGLALLIAPTLCAFTVGKGAWLQHRAQTLALWCMFAQTFPAFQDHSKYAVVSSYNPTVYTIVSAIALASNIAVFAYMIYKVVKTKRNPYLGELYTDLKKYKEVKELAEQVAVK
ncbi:MAG: hypothetical protein GXY01_01340 [Clostridiales bacterium]|jgi:hypothetical protein|nr:hypothetical protein [Clostridiales bacterium]